MQNNCLKTVGWYVMETELLSTFNLTTVGHRVGMGH